MIIDVSPLRPLLALPLLLAAGVAYAQPRPLPPLPDPSGGPPAVVAPTAVRGGEAPPPAPLPPLERAKRGVVSVERSGQALGVGTVLANDGRVITALSVLGGALEADVRYADGSVVHARLGHKDRAFDLALLVPLAGRWQEGLKPSGLDPATAELRTFGRGGPKAVPALVATAFKARVDARSKEGDGLPGVLDLDLKNQPAPGAPVVDGAGDVTGIVITACKGNDTSQCAPVIVGAPMGAVRRFLMSTPATAALPSPRLGIRGERDAAVNVRGVRVLALAPGGPAERAGLRGNELIFAVDGEPVETPEQLQEAIGRRAVGDTIKLLFWGGDRFREVPVVLRAAS